MTLLTGVNGGTFPNQTTGPAAGEFITASSVNNGLQGVLNECKYLYDTKANLAGATFTGLVTIQGDLYIDASTLLVQSGAGFGIAEGATATCADSFTLQGSATTPARLVYGNRSRLNIPVTRLSDADHTVNADTDGPVIILAKPTAVRTITIEQATDTLKENGDTLEFYIPVPPDNAADYWVFKREGSANNIALFTGDYGAGTWWPGYVRIHLEGGVWRLSTVVGGNFDTDA